jgi:hypothetical protein
MSLRRLSCYPTGSRINKVRPVSFTFEYVGTRYDREWESHFVFGRLVEGSIHLNDSISVATTAGDQNGTVVRFLDSLYDWLGMPFYHTVSDEFASPFCIVIGGLTSMPVCPGVAWSSGTNPA